MSDDALDALKQEKLQQLQQAQTSPQDAGVDQEEQLRKQLREQVKRIAAQFFTAKARDRLNNVRTVKPELAQQIEMYLVQLHRAGQINGEITDDQLKNMLKKLQDTNTRERTIKYR